MVDSDIFYTFALSINDKEKIINDLKKNEENMEDLICNVELNGEGVWAQLKGDAYEMSQGETNVSEDVVKQTAQQIYDAVKNEDYRNTKYAVRITADFKDDYIKGLIDKDYSTEFMPVMDRNFYKMNDYKYPYGIEDEVVEYDKDEIEYYILSEYKHFYDCDTECLYENWVNEKLYEMGFNKLCREKGIEVEIEYAKIRNTSVEYDGDSFLFRTYVILNVYDRDDE